MIDFRDRVVLVTGIAGFVGANLAGELIARGARVHGLVRTSTNLWRLDELLPGVVLHRTDLSDARALEGTLRQTRPSIIYHLATRRAAHTREERVTTLASNLGGSLNLLEAALAVGCERLVYTASSLEYGPRAAPTREDDPLAPVSFFGATKAASLLLCRQFASQHRLPLVTLRLYSVYGYWEGPERLIPTAMLAALGAGSIALTNGGYHRDLVFVSDVVEACLLAASADLPPGEVFNIGTGQQWSNEQVVDMIQAIAGRTLHRQLEPYPARDTDTRFWVADNTKARALLGWNPRFSLRDGLEKTWAFMGRHHERYVNRARGMREEE